jgi:hypothetical protein
MKITIVKAAKKETKCQKCVGAIEEIELEVE